MSEIEKMYKSVNVKAINIAEYGSTYIPNGVEIDGKLYPPFTAEKQIELIKWLAINKEDFGIHYRNYDEEYHWVCGCEFNVEDYLRFDEDRTFEESLAGLINNIWQDLTEEEKQQVKGILE